MNKKYIEFDFNPLLFVCGDIINSTSITPKQSDLLKLKNELNKFFKDSKCTEVVYNVNNNLFYGMCTYPIIDEELINSILQDDKNVRFNKYSIEIDSKLMNPILDLTPKEFLAILLHEIGHIVNDPNPVEDVRNAMAIQLAKTGDSLGVPKSIQYMQILSFGIKDTVRKLNSMFFIYKDGEVLADEFVHMCGFGEYLNNAFTKICKSGMLLNPEVNKLTALTWSLALYKSVKLKRIPAVRLIRKMKSMTSSKLEKRELENLERALNGIDDSMIQEYCDLNNRSHYFVLNENGKERRTKYSSLRKEATLKMIKPFKDEVYEYAMRSRHVADEEDALYLMRQLNLRISVIEDYLENEVVSEKEREEWWKILDKYHSIRETLANKTKYKYDYTNSVIQVTYPDIVPNRM